MLGPDQTTPILAQLPVSSSNAESEVASDFDNEMKLIRAKAIVILQVELAARPIRRCHDPIMGFYYSAFSNRNNDSGMSPNISPTVQPHLRV